MSDPKSWRISQSLTLQKLAEMMDELENKQEKKISTGQLSDIENGKRAASGRITNLYFVLSSGEVTPPEFPKQH